jgi:hypothetical protein
LGDYSELKLARSPHMPEPTVQSTHSVKRGKKSLCEYPLQFVMRIAGSIKKNRKKKKIEKI